MLDAHQHGGPDFITIWLTAFALIWLLHGRARFRHFVSAARPKLPMMGELIGIGWPVAITYGVESTLFLATGLTVGVLGATALEAVPAAVAQKALGGQGWSAGKHG
mgnify:CR=1 FL=1